MKRKNELSSLILRAADYVADLLCDNGCIVHRYDAVSTSSVYLKVDAGVACSIRLSDHEGNSRLKYRFNYLANVPGDNVEYAYDEMERSFYQAGAIDRMIEDILDLREQRYLMYRDYDETVRLRFSEGANAKGFWQKAYLVSKQESQAA